MAFFVVLAGVFSLLGVVLFIFNTATTTGVRIETP